MENFLQYLKLTLCIILMILGLSILFTVEIWANNLVLMIILYASGAGLLFLGAKLTQYADSHILRRIEKEYNDNYNYLKTNGEFRLISFRNIEILGQTDFTYEKANPYYSKIVMLDGLIGIDRSNKKKIIDYSILRYKEKIHNDLFTFWSQRIKMDSITLSFLLERENDIKLYIDKENFDNYSFDLDFLKK